MRRPFLYCLEGWIIGEGFAFLFGVRETLTAAFIFILSILAAQSTGFAKICTKTPGAGFRRSENKSGFYLLRFYLLRKENIKKYKKILILASVCCCLAALRVQFTKRDSKLYKEAGQRGELTLTLDGRIKAQKKSQSGTAVILSDCVFEYEGTGGKLKDKVIVYGVEREYLMGQRIRLSGEFSLQTAGTNPGQFNSYIYYRARGIYGRVFCKKAEKVYGEYSPVLELARRMQVNFQKIYEKLFSKEEEGILSAMILGEKNKLSDEIKTLYQDNGISHILAISGLHISFLGMNLYKRLRKALLPFPVCALISALFLFFYGCMVGFSHSLLRAVLMLCFLFAADIVGRSYDLTSALSFSAVFLLALYPHALFDAGTLLSFGAVFGIALILPILEAKKDADSKEKKKKCASKLKEGIFASLRSNIAIWITTVPVLLHFYYELPVYGLFVNLLILPLLSYLLPLAVFSLILGSIFLPLGSLAALPTSAILSFYKSTAAFFSALPFSKWTVGNLNLLQYIFYILIVGGILALRCCQKQQNQKREAGLSGERKIYTVIYTMLSLFLIAVFSMRDSAFRLTMLDVGQGDGIFMELEDGTSFLIDGGSSSNSKLGTYVLLPALKYYGISQLDYVMISHEDSDHISGVIELLEQKYPVKNLILPYREAAKKAENYEKLIELAKKQETKIIFLKRGDELKKGALSFYCLHPSQSAQTGDVNSDSMVLSMQYGEFRMLWTGDLAGEGEDAVTKELEKRQENSYTVLKVPHHGSKKSALEPFLSRVRPSIALISCSASNNYGHPGRETLKRLEAVGSKIYITKDEGAIELRIEKAGKLKIKTYESGGEAG